MGETAKDRLTELRTATPRSRFLEALTPEGLKEELGRVEKGRARASGPLVGKCPKAASEDEGGAWEEAVEEKHSLSKC